ncbi:peptide/nickel transport system permease protein [Jatrophihabitans endophyticus]|uniref:Peptide/nickel transport system permease protein n=1 Tax=Jatrophihabitans endophyticus TaxID=1206085 RepID=A0A1M5KNE6_9ACTN|nr:ABC transporter permease [Jatrophihabitans endophyticus]SHG54281.1 peptide/nickel transport system permease protein [Jatrophihabitans endophyticus]
MSASEYAPPPSATSAAVRAGGETVVSRFCRDRWAVAGVVVVVVLVVAAFAAPLITAINGQNPYSYAYRGALGDDGAPVGALGGVGLTHWFGVEPLTGRDLFAVVLYGARTSILVGVGATVVEVVIGGLLGAAAALFGGWTDRILSRVTDVVVGFPSLIFMIALGAFAPEGFPKGLLVVLVIGLLGWGSTARIVRSQCLSLMQRNFVTASRAMGAGPAHLLREQLLPNLASTLIVITATHIPINIGYEAALSFLGVGVPPPTPAWGRTISNAVAWIATDPWYLLAPAAALFLVTFAFNLVGDGLRDALDPRLAGGE